jgi:hypothetical protein
MIVSPALLQDHMKRVKAIHEKDLAEGWGRVQLPDALDRKYPNAPKDWRWQWVASRHVPRPRPWRDQCREAFPCASPHAGTQ